MPRIAPAEPPYAADIQQAFDRITPPGFEPLLLFRTLAASPRVYERFRNGGLLDRGPLSLRQREIAIDRTCAIARCEYEWGVHIAFFSAKAGLTSEQVYATAWGTAEDACWTEAEQAIIALCDELYAVARISDALWARLRTHFDEQQILELIALAGFYRTVSYFANGLQLPLESYAARFPARADRDELE
ncbi:MAG TPA: carboxymuconolactone decarboxylase family protein [Stellaceae bacterium]